MKIYDDPNDPVFQRNQSPRANFWRAAGALLFVVFLGIGVINMITGQSDTFFGLGQQVQLFPHQAKKSVAAEDAGDTADTAEDKHRAIQALEKLNVAPLDALNHYDRQRLFGRDWLDLDGDQCDTRNEILARDLVEVKFRQVHPTDCVVQSGVLHDAYSGKTIHFDSGAPGAAQVQIDYVVALGNVWRTGGQDLSQQRREQIANDPLNLQAVAGELHREKKSQDAASWLPPNLEYRCEYVARQIAVKKKYRLWVTPTEKTRMSEVLNGCPRQKLPAE